MSYHNGNRKHRRRRVNFPRLIVTIVLFILICAAGVLGYLILSDNTKAVAVPPAEQPNPSYEVKSKNIDGNGMRVSKITDTDGVNVTAYYPQFDIDFVDTAIEGLVRDKITQFKEETAPGNKTIDNSLVAVPKELNMDFDVYSKTPKLISVCFEANATANNTRTDIDVLTASFDIANKRQLKFGDLFIAGSNYLDVLSEKLKQQLQDNPEYSLEENKEKLDELTAPKANNFKRFALDNANLYIIHILPSQSNYEVVKFPFTQIKDIINIAGFSAATPSPAPTQEPTPEPSPGSTTEGNGIDTHGKPVVALTFDDGPSSKTTNRLLDILKENDAKATFFVLGERVAGCPDTIKRIVDEGHELESHTYDHKSLIKLSESKIRDEVRSTDEAIEAILPGYKTKYVRPPFGDVNKLVRSTVDKPLIHWSIDSEDWKSEDKDVASAKVLNEVSDGAIVLLHDIHEFSVDAAEIIIKSLKAEGYIFVTIDQLLTMDGVQPVAGKKYRSRSENN